MADFISDAEMDKLHPSNNGFISDDEMDKLGQQSDEFSTPVEELKTGAEGLARGATLGLSDLAETKLGISTPERIKARKEANPLISTGTEIAGGIGSTLLAPEAAPLALLERGGTSLAARVTAKKIASQALKDAVIGAGQGVGNLISEKSLGNTDLTAEQVMGTVGLGTILGGTIGASMTGIGLGAKKTLNDAKIPDMLEKALGGRFAKISGYLSDKDPDAIHDLFKNRLKATISDDERQVVQDQIVQHIKYQDAALSNFSKATTQARPDQMGSLLKQQYGTSINEQQLDAMDAVHSSITNTINKMRAEPEIYTKVGTVRRLETIAQGLNDNIEGYNKNPEHLYAYMNKLKQKMDDLARFEGVIPDSERDTIREVRRLRGELKQTLEDNGLWGVAGDRQAAYNKATNRFMTAQKKFYKQFAVKTTDDAGNVIYDIDDNKLHTYLYNHGQSKNGRKEKILENYLAKSNAYIQEAKQVHADLNVTPPTVPTMDLPNDQMETVQANNLLRRLKSPYRGTGVRENLAAPGMVATIGGAAATGHPLLAASAAAFSALSNPVSTIEKIAALEQVKGKAVKMFNTHLDSMLAGKSADLATLTAVDLAGRQHLLKDRQSRDTTANTFKNRVNEIAELAAQPDLLNDRLAQTTQGIQGVNQVQGQLTTKLANGVSYLANTAPKDPSVGLLMRKEWQPKPSDMMAWNRRLAAVQNPYSVLENPSNEGIDTLKNVYPEIYAEMTKQVYEKLANKPEHEVPYKARLKLSRIFGLNLDGTNQADVALLQATYAQAGQPQNVKRSSRKMNTASAAQTDTDEIESKLT